MPTTAKELQGSLETKGLSSSPGDSLDLTFTFTLTMFPGRKVREAGKTRKGGKEGSP